MKFRICSLVLVVCLVAVSCRVDVDQLGGATPNAAPSNPVAATELLDGLPVLGPIPGGSHWHAAYVVRICDEVLAPFDSTLDPLGIHSHSDGVMHVHPFFEEAGYENATVGLFADAMGMTLRQGEITLPDGRIFRDGDLCGDVPSQVFVDRWADNNPDTAVSRIFDDPGSTRFLADGELYQIGFAPSDSPPVVPPTAGLLNELSNLNQPVPEPWVDPDPQTSLDQVRVWPVESVTAPPCEPGQVSERVRSGEPACLRPSSEGLPGSDAIEQARAVSFNRQPSVELRISGALRRLIDDHFANGNEAPLTLAVEVDGAVVTAPTIQRLPVSEDRLVVSGGFTVESASQLAVILGGS